MSDFENNDKTDLKKDFEEQYAELQQEQEEDKKRKTIILLIIFMLTLLVSASGATYSYLKIRNVQTVTPVIPYSYTILKDGRIVSAKSKNETITKDKFGNVIIPDGGATITTINGGTSNIPKGAIVTCDGMILIPEREGNSITVKEDGNYIIPNGGATRIDIDGNTLTLKAGLHVGNCTINPDDSSSTEPDDTSSTNPDDSSNSSQSNSNKPSSTNSSTTKPENPINPKPENQTITIIYTDTSSYKAESVVPGWQSDAAKTFTVRCEGAATGYYKVEWVDVINTFNHPEDLVYTVKINGITQFEDRQVPTSDSLILANKSIVPGGVQNYEIFFKYINRNANQNEDQDKIFSGKINVSVD